MTTKDKTNPHVPLTAEQQALIVQWLPFSRVLAFRFLKAHPHLRHLEDECYAVAQNAGVKAVQKWRPDHGTYASCLAWWVRAALQDVAKGAVSRTEQISWDTPMGVSPSGRLYMSHSDSYQLCEFVPSPPQPEETLEEAFARYSALMDEEVPVYLVGHCAAPSIQRFARESVALWKRWRIDGETQAALADEMGCSRQAMSQRLSRAQAAFEKWARSIRKEAA